MDADLVSAAGVDFDIEQGEFSVVGFEAAFDGVVGDGLAASGARGWSCGCGGRRRG